MKDKHMLDFTIYISKPDYQIMKDKHMLDYTIYISKQITR